MSTHYRLFVDTKQQYETFFRQAEIALGERLQILLTPFSCENCPPKARSKPGPAERLSEALPLNAGHPGCGYHPWREAALELLEREIPGEILASFRQIDAYKKTFQCRMGGQCCRLASSEHSYEALTAKAAAGDAFARQFTSVFLPYASRQAAREREPEGVAAVLAYIGDASSLEAAGNEKTSGTERVYFYHCPYIGEDNRCTVYGTNKRPAICENYPETPLGFVFKSCAWKRWQEETHPETLLAHAMLALCEVWSARLRPEDSCNHLEAV
jgi:Fe-S-cluster containining protein